MERAAPLTYHGGARRGRKFSDRLVAVHLAFFYYWAVVLMFMLYPAAAYNFNKIVEEHAYTTYDTFLNEYADELRALPVPDIAREYYESDKTRFSDRTFLSADTGKLVSRPKGEKRERTTALAPPLRAYMMCSCVYAMMRPSTLIRCPC